MFDKIRDIFQPNRVAALTGVVTAIIAFLVTLESSFVPGSPGEEAIAKAIVMLGSVLTVLKIIDKFLEGSQNWDSLLFAGQPKKGGSVVSADAEANIDTDELDSEGQSLYDRNF